MKAGRAMHSCQICPTDTAPLISESICPELCQNKRKHLDAGNLSAPIISILADVAIISFLRGQAVR